MITENDIIPNELRFKDDLVNGTFGTNGFQVEQDVTPFLKQAAIERQMANGRIGKYNSMRKVATIPDIVAIEILTKHKIDLHDEETTDNPRTMKRVMQILQSEYPHILSVDRI